jgi:hypothetical protein
MERTVPSTASEEVELYLRTYYSLLRSTAEVHIRTLEEVHAGMRSLLHPSARESVPDMAAFIYSLLRLPACMHKVQLVVLGQSPEVFARQGYMNIETWEPVFSIARRRRVYFNRQDTLACFIASRSDIDDVIPMLTAYQIEWNKIHYLLKRFLPDNPHFDFQTLTKDVLARHSLADGLQISVEDLDRLQVIWGNAFQENLERVAGSLRTLRVRLLSGSLSAYRRATNLWWEKIESAFPEIIRRPVYFISSNTHSLANLVTGYALQIENRLVKFLDESENCDLLAEWEDIRASQVDSSRENFLYYVLKEYTASTEGKTFKEEQRQVENDCGLFRVTSEHSFDVDAQVVELRKLLPMEMDPRLVGETGLRTGGKPDDLAFLSQSDAMILNIDYPLGLAAYNILTEVAEHAGQVLGVYVMGKAASLNGTIGDVVIPNVVHDEHSKNTYLFSNCFAAADITPYLMYGSVLDNQKSVTVRGTFLQNANYMDVFYREGYTDIEMEAGAYLSAVYEMHRPQRHPMNEIINLYGLPFDLGIVHYVSDNPISKGRNLGAGSLSYYGMDSTYAASLAVLRRIFQVERGRLSG